MPTTPGINVTITNNKSLDITSSFQTRLWIQPKIVAPSNLTGRGWGGSRIISRCSSSTGIFRFSHCNHDADIEGSMQRYTVYCREPTPQINWYDGDLPNGMVHAPPTVGEQGSCYPDEICINGLWRRTGYSAVARCVKQDDFKILLGGGGESDVQLGNRMASVVLSREDGSRPLGAGSMGAAYAESGQVMTREEMSDMDQMCHNCFELATQKSTPDTDSLKVEASLATAGAVLGVMWLAVLSG